MAREIRPWRSPKYLNRIRGEPCLVCGSPPPVQAHHTRHSERRGFSRKTSDKYAVPLCWECHASCHTRGNESEWWALHGIDALDWAAQQYEEYIEGEI